MIRTLCFRILASPGLPALVCVGLVLQAGQAHCQPTIDVPDKIEAKTGRLATVTIKTTAKETKWIIVPSDNIDQFREFDPDPAIIRLRFLPYQDGAYTLVVAGALADKETIRTCTITAKGGLPPPPPVPPPGPPDPGPSPGPGPTTKADFIIGITDNERRDLKVASILEDHALAKWLDDNKIKWRVIDIGQKAFTDYSLDKILNNAKVTPPAIITYTAGKLLRAGPAPASSEAVKAFVEGKRQSYPQGGEDRYLTPLDPSEAKLVPDRKLERWVDKKGIIPRDQWKDIDRRNIFGGPDWIYDQNSHGSCVGNGATGALRRVRYLAGMKDQKLSPGCTYAQINGGRDNGAVIGDSLTALTRTGTCLYITVGQDPIYLNRLPVGWKQEAARFKVDQAYVAPTFDELVSGIQLGYVAVYGMQVGNNFGSFSKDGVAGVSRGSGNHCMHADGCKKLPDGTWALDNVNSWGPNWGPWRNGRCYLIDKHINGANNSDAYLIKGASEDPQEPVRPPLQLPKSRTSSSPVNTPTVIFEPAQRC
jgi:hypothetical protein